MAGRKTAKRSRARKQQRSERPMEENTGNMPSLPREIIFAIFLHVAAKILTVIKFFCREWYRVISDPTFIRAHLIRAKTRLIFQAPAKGSKIDILALEVNRTTRNRVTLLSSQELHGENYRLYIRASCDGLLLLENSVLKTRKLVVTNPITGQWSELPKPRPDRRGPIVSIQGGTFGLYFYGFAYDKLSGKNKVVRLFRDLENTLTCEVFTLGSDSWRKVNSPAVLSEDDFNEINYRPVAVDGVVYWVSKVLDDWPTFVFDPKHAYIIFFDVSNEDFGYLPNPAEFRGICRLLEMGGKLSLLKCTHTQLDVWILEDHRRVLWTKKYSTIMFDVIDGLRYTSLQRCFEPIATVENGDILVFREGFKLYTFDLKHSKMEEIKTHVPYMKRNCVMYLSQIPFPHVDSLVKWET